MFVLFVLDLFVGRAQDLCNLAVELVRALPDQLPIQMILGLGEYHALARHQLGGSGVARGERHLHGLHEGLARVLDDLAPGRLLARVEAQALAHGCEDYDMVFRLLEILLPFVAEVLVQYTFESRLVNENATLLVFQGLEQ